MNCRRQALSFCLDTPAVIINKKFLLEVFHCVKRLQIQQLTFDKPEEIFYHSVVQTVSLATHALAAPLLSEHLLILLVLVLPALV